MSTSTESAPSKAAKDHVKIRVYNTLTREKEPFHTVQPGKVSMYLCGPTVYKEAHIGHMVGPVIFDCIKRYLVYSGYDVKWVVNITDVDDKLIAESKRRGISMAEVADEMTQDYLENLQALGVDQIDEMPRATDHIQDIIDFTAEPGEKRVRVRIGWGRLLRSRQRPRLRQTQQSYGRQPARRRRGDGCPEEGGWRFRVVEKQQAWRALLGQPVGQGSSGLAHRVLGHEPCDPGRGV